MELTSVLAFQGNYEDPLKYSRMLTHMVPVEFLQALSPPSPVHHSQPKEHGDVFRTVYTQNTGR